MKKTNLFTLAVLLTMVLTAGTSYGQTTPAGPRIVHEEEEITVFDDNGKELEKHYVGKIGDQKMAIIKDARSKKRKYKETDIQHPKLKFYDENGKLVKEMDLSNVKSKGTIKETRRFYTKGEYEADLETAKEARVSKNGGYVVIRNTTTASVGGVLAEGVVSGSIDLYDTTGKRLFEKQFELGREVLDYTVSDSGVVAAITLGTGDQRGESWILYAYDKTAKELLKFPDETTKGQPKGKYPEASPLNVLRMSPNGRYFAARVDFAYESDHTRTVFFDLENNTLWKADKSYVVYEMSDNGVVTADYYDKTTKKRSKTIHIDLTEKR